MSFRQLYYTACDKGLSPGAGFQFNAASPDMNPMTLQRIERLGSYAAPRSAPLRPTPEELERFPISLFFYTLEDDGVVLGQAKYIGLMADGRYGNFFAHSLVTDDPYSDFFRDDQLFPIETWLSECWVTTEHDSTVLPALKKIPFGNAINFAKVQEFLRDPARREILPRYLSAVTEALKTNRRIILIDDNDSVALWIAAASYVLPYHLVLRLTFSTYVQNPYNTDALITGTTEDSSFNFAPHEIEHLFSVFDIKSERFTPIDPNGFAVKAAYLYQQTYGKVITGFPVFVEQTAPDMSVEELEDALSTYCYFENQHVPDVNDVRVLAWSSRHLTTLADKDFTNLFNTIVGKGEIEVEILRAATDFYLAALNSSIDTPAGRQANDLYVRWLITEASRNVDPVLLNETADRLPVQTYQGDGAESIFKEWLRHLKDADRPTRFAAILRLGDRIGFTEEENDILLWLGKNVAAAWLTNAPLQQSIREISSKGGGKCILEGIAAFLVEHVDNLQLFASFPTLISDADSYSVLSSYAVKTQNLPLYLRLSGLKVNLEGSERIEALTAQMADIQTSFKTGISVAIMQTAFNSIWFEHAPTLDEACKLLSPPLYDYVVKSEIPSRLISSLNFSDVVLTAQQIELIEKLNTDAVFSAVDDRAKVTITAYAMAGEFQSTPDNIDRTNASLYLQWLTINSRQLPQIAPRLFEFLGRKFITVKDGQLHAQMLPDYLKENSFLQSYQQEIQELSRIRKSHQELARLVEIWTQATRHKRAMESHLQNWIALILKNLSRKDIEKLEAALNDDTFRVWARMKQRIELEQKSTVGRFFDKILGRD